MTNVEKLKKIIEHEEEIEIFFTPERRQAKYLESIAESLAIVADILEEHFKKESQNQEKMKTYEEKYNEFFEWLKAKTENKEG